MLEIWFGTTRVVITSPESSVSFAHILPGESETKLEVSDGSMANLGNSVAHFDRVKTLETNQKCKIDKNQDSKHEESSINSLTKVIDHKKMLLKFELNITIQQYCTSELKSDPSFSRKTIILVSNYTYVIRTLLHHLFLLSLPHLPHIQLPLMLCVEFTYLANLVGRYASTKHFKSLRFFLFRALESVLLLALQVVNLIILTDFGGRNVPPSLKLQRFGCYMVYFSLLLQHINLLISVGIAVFNTFFKAKKKDIISAPYIELVRSSP